MKSTPEQVRVLAGDFKGEDEMTEYERVREEIAELHCYQDGNVWEQLRDNDAIGGVTKPLYRKALLR